MTSFFWGVSDDAFTLRPIATFFAYGDAVAFVGASKRNLYVCEPQYDRRKSGYRFEEQLTECRGDPLLRRVA